VENLWLLLGSNHDRHCETLNQRQCDDASNKCKYRNNEFNPPVGCPFGMKSKGTSWGPGTIDAQFDLGLSSVVVYCD
jgi:hypothetical protein